ncbi:NTP/NDP exchange transporter [Mesoterricola silvestris]|uniref:MFS transporter n=1 Tax=Mesoterricola silvestris TaxID=2927979 RepID=A0AA48KC51_9BACT|nr:hypothetical protein [Mesoterricola silvestris]BDU74992.1 MFS transporter [Mesoterricola silvestris]
MSPSAPQRFLARLVLVRPGEGAILLLSTAYFFLLFYGYYLLRPVREAFGIARGADKLPWLMTGTMALMFLANPAFSALVSRFPRRRSIPMAYRFCGATLAAFYLAFRFLPGHGGPGLGYAFYIWLSVFNLFAVSIFWAFMADGLDQDQGRRLFGFIAMGGTLGAIAGASTTAFLAGHRVDAGTLLLVTILCLELAILCVRTLASRFGMGAGSADREPGPGLFQGIRLLAGSPYLALMALYILLYTITSTFLYMQQGAIVARTFTGAAARTAAFARIDLGVNVLTLVTQVFLSSRLIKAVGMRVVLCILPLLTLAGFGALWALPTFGTLALFQVLRRGLHYAVDRPAREVLYIPLGPGEKYKAKPFIDTFIYRAGDLLGTWTPALMAAARLPLGAVALAVSGAWVWGGVALGNLQRKR